MIAPIVVSLLTFYTVSFIITCVLIDEDSTDKEFMGRWMLSPLFLVKAIVTKGIPAIMRMPIFLGQSAFVGFKELIK